MTWLSPTFELKDCTFLKIDKSCDQHRIDKTLLWQDLWQCNACFFFINVTFSTKRPWNSKNCFPFQQTVSERMCWIKCQSETLKGKMLHCYFFLYKNIEWLSLTNAATLPSPSLYIFFKAFVSSCHAVERLKGILIKMSI